MPLQEALSAIANPVRRTIIREVAASPEWSLACGTIELGVSKATRSHHFAVLRGIGLLEQRDVGSRRFNNLRRAEFEAVFPGLLALVLSEPESDHSVTEPTAVSGEEPVPFSLHRPWSGAGGVTRRQADDPPPRTPPPGTGAGDREPTARRLQVDSRCHRFCHIGKCLAAATATQGRSDRHGTTMARARNRRFVTGQPRHRPVPPRPYRAWWPSAAAVTRSEAWAWNNFLLRELVVQL
ncbi:helix-turn-helix transcriptional regulator [Streptacidiphilus sp. 4-A2]|nr:helix-turn-helix transcriptional regulator [Streptacidiphilus sp. 4-A2]